MPRPIWLLSLLCALNTSESRAQSSWDRYTPGTLTAIVDAHAPSVATSCDTVRPCTMVSGEDFASAVHVTYLGEVRPLPSATFEHILTWAKTLGIDTASASAFGSEIRVREGSTEFWLPIQSVFLEAFNKEVPSGHGVTLLTIFTGGYLERGTSPQWVFLVNEFQSDE